jgi:hypothetical protein
MYGDKMMKRTQQDQVAEAGRPAFGPRLDVVHMTDPGRLAAAGGGAVPVAGDDRPPLVRRDGVGDLADVKRQADRWGKLRGEQPGPQERREPSPPRQDIPGA